MEIDSRCEALGPTPTDTRLAAFVWLARVGGEKDLFPRVGRHTEKRHLNLSEKSASDIGLRTNVLPKHYELVRTYRGFSNTLTTVPNDLGRRAANDRQWRDILCD